jgi:hypothetical protein
MNIAQKMIQLYRVKNSNLLLRQNMSVHYSQPKGFVGRNLCYLIYEGSKCYGSIVAGSAGMNLAGRDAYFELTKQTKKTEIQRIANNVFFHIERVNGKYPRNFAPKVLALFRERVAIEWEYIYGVSLLGFETLVEPPRTGEIYLRDGWEQVGITKGQTCKRASGTGTDTWTGKRIWDTENLRPKIVLCRKITQEN